MDDWYANLMDRHDDGANPFAASVGKRNAELHHHLQHSSILSFPRRPSNPSTRIAELVAEQIAKMAAERISQPGALK